MAVGIAVYLCLVYISTLIACLELNIALCNLNSLQKRVNRIFRTVLLSQAPTMRLQRRFKPYERRFWTRPGRTSAWWDNFVNEVVMPEEWRENFECSGTPS